MVSLRIAFTLVLSAAPVAAAPAATPAATDDPAAASIRRGDAYAHLVAAGLAVSRGRGADAAREIGEAVALEPNSAALHSQGASLLAMLGRRAEAEKLARQALELDARQVEAVRVLADLAAARSFGPKADPAARAEAIRLYEKLTVEDPKAPDEIWAALAKLKLASGDQPGAVAAARKYFARRPGDETALRLLDQALVAAGGTKEALATTLAWIKAHPDDGDDLLPLVVEMARETGEWPLIESMLDGLIAANPDNARARGLRGEARLRQGHAKEALEDLELARAAAPRDPMVRLHIAAAYQAENRLADATQIAESLASEYPDNTFVRLLLAETLARRGETDAAREEYSSALRGLAGDDPDDVARRDEVRLRIAALDLGAKKMDEAKAVLGALEKPDATPSLAVRARAALLAGDAKEAKRLARLLATNEPGDGALIDGEVELTLGRTSKANERFEAAVAKAGPQARGDVAAILRRNGRDADAERQLRAWVAAAPEDAEGRLALGAWLDRAGRLAEGESELREAMRLDPRSAEAFNYLGYSLAERGERLEEAVELIRKALVIDPWNGAYLDSLGWAYVKLGRLADAREPLERAVREFPRDPTVLEHLGDYFSRTGDQGRARTYWQRAMEAGPETPAAKDGLQKKLDASRPAAGPPENQTAVVVPPS